MATRIELRQSSTPSPAPVGATLMKTGQTTSYRTGDDGDIEAGRAFSFFGLASNNPFGNTKRFTDELGTEVYANNIVIDWSTYNGSNVLGWYRIAKAGGTTDWNLAIDESQGLNIGGFNSGWRLPNVQEYCSIFYFSSNVGLFFYAPFNLNIASSNQFLWTSTTNPAGTTQALSIVPYQFGIARSTKTTLLSYIPCRTFTVTGTTLT